MPGEKKMEKKHIVDDFSTFKSQENFSRKERIFAEVMFSEIFLEFFEKTTKEMLEENDPKNAEIFTNLMQEIGESIQQLNAEKIDARVQTMVFLKILIAIVMEYTSLELKNKGKE